MKKATFFIIWGGMYLLCVIFGFLPREGGALGAVSSVISLLFFLPPGCLMLLAWRQKDSKLRKLLGSLSGGVLLAALSLLVLTILCFAAPAWVGTLLQALLVLLCPPIGTCGQFALCLFLWACLFFTAFFGKKQQKQ